MIIIYLQNIEILVCIKDKCDKTHFSIVQELRESRGGRPNEPSGFRGCKAILNHALALVSACPNMSTDILGH